jgi:hypothetical protein
MATTPDHLLFRKEFGKLVPAEDAAAEWLKKQPAGKDFWLPRPKRARNARWHRLYMKLLHVVYDNLPEPVAEHYPTFERFRKALMKGIGRYDVWQTRNGDLMFEPHSLAFDKMEQDEFEQVWADSVKVITEQFLPGVGSQELENEVMELVA